MNKNKMIIAAPIVWAAIVLWLHVGRMPSSEHASWLPPHTDKIVHFSMFMTLGFLHARAWMFLKKSPASFLFFITTSVSLLYGASLEGLQSLLTYRGADVFDWMADGIGSIVGTTLATTRIWKSWWSK